MTDPFSYLEDKDSPQTASFYAKHNKGANEYFVRTSQDYFAHALEKLQDTDLRGLPVKRGKYSFYVERRADWQHPKLMVGFGAEARILYDPTTEDESLDFWYPSPDGKKVICGVSMSGNEQTTIKILDTHSTKPLSDTIPFAGFTDQGDICWLDNKRFIYPRMNGFNKQGPEDKWLLGSKLYLHIVGKDPAEDVCVYGKDLPETVMLIPTLSSDKSKLYIAVCEDELTHKIFEVDLVSLVSRQVTSGTHSAFKLKTAKGRVYALTNYQADKYRLLMCDESTIEYDFDYWDEVLPESEGVLKDFWLTSDNRVLALYTENVASVLKVYDAYGNQDGIIDIPAMSTVQSVVCDSTSTCAFISVSGYTVPTVHLKVTHLLSDPEVVWQRTALAGDNDIDVEQYFARSADGTPIPFFFICRKMVDGSRKPAPTIIYGYGGFNISLEPSYLSMFRPWVLAGGAVVIANLRGGSEFGEAWHKGGAMQNKQNTFNDAIAVAEKLVADGLSSKTRLGIMGGSNGGLLVSAVTVQRPDLFRAGASLVPLTDMLEFYKHQVAEFWVHEYGDPHIPEQREWIMKWSPYHYPIDTALTYPALYYETALNDARVHPFHAFKMVARLEDKVTVWKGPLLLRTWTDTGHQSSNLSKKQSAQRTAEIFAFFAQELGLVL